MAPHPNFIWFCSTIVIWMRIVTPMALLNHPSLFLEGETSESDLATYITSKGYLPRDRKLPKSSIVKSSESDVTYLLSKLSDQEVIKLLNEQPKKIQYDLQDILNVAIGSQPSQGNQMVKELRQPEPLTELNNNYYDNQNTIDKRVKLVSQTSNPKGAFFRLEHKEVDPYMHNSYADPNYVAVQKLSNLLYSRPVANEPENTNSDDDENNELLFDLLVAQLKTLCCKKNKPKKHANIKYQYKALLGDMYPHDSLSKSNAADTMKSEHMFLIINDEVKSNGSEDIISVDPESLSKNSSVLLLGPIATPLSDGQLKLVMTRISNELSKPEYIPLLQQLSDGVLSDNNMRIMKSLVTGPETRRYIKPHRCNHQSPLAKVYGGPKWIVCTGYLNLNTPSLYD